jgi:hypothetical protein
LPTIRELSRPIPNGPLPRKARSSNLIPSDLRTIRVAARK